MGTIDPRPRLGGGTSYRARIRLRGHPPLSETFTRKRDAENWIAETERAIKLGIYAVDESRRHTFAELVERYVFDGCPTLQPRRGSLSGLEVEKRKATLGWWTERLGAHYLAAVTLPAVEDRMRALAAGDSRSGKPVGPATINRYLAALSAVLTYGVRLRWLNEHPLKARIVRAVEPEPDPVFFRRLGDVEDPAEAEWPRIKEACRRSRDRRLFPALLMAAVSGARPAELWLMPGAKTKPLRWEHLDLRRGVGRLPTSKSGRQRVLAFDGEALEALREYARVRPLAAVYVMESARGSTRFPRNAWTKAQEVAGVSLTWRKLRHTAASWALISGNVSLAAIGAYMDHSSAQTTKRYAHLVEAGAREIAAATSRDL